MSSTLHIILYIMKNKKIRTRFGPSPTGGCHIGGLRTALYNYMFAKKHGGDFILRIEDTDETRFDPNAELHIIESLKWIGIIPDEGVGFGDGPIVSVPGCANGLYGPYRQSDRNKAGIYKPFVDKLILEGNAYYAFDTKEELTAARVKMWAYNSVTRLSMNNSLNMSADEIQSKLDDKIPYVIRFKVIPNEDIIINDIIRGSIVTNSNIIDDKVLFKSTNMPSYHLANVVDDHLMDITHVIRGEEWLSSCSFHYLLYRSLGWADSMPKFAHLPLILNPDGSKLSKRTALKNGYTVFAVNYTGVDSDGDTVNIDGFRELGFEADALRNSLALLGWHASGEKEIMPLDEMINEFSIEKCGSSGAIFDFPKLKAINFDYVRNLAPDVLVPIKGLTPEAHAKIVAWTRERTHLLGDAVLTWGPFVTAPPLYSGKWSKEAEDTWAVFSAIVRSNGQLTPLPDTDDTSVTVAAMKTILNATNDWNAEYIGIAIGAAMLETGAKNKFVMSGLRTALTGGTPGPDLIGTMEIIGRDETLSRLDKASKYFANELPRL